MKIPGNDRVAVAWLETLGLTADDIGMEIPPPAEWAINGFVQASTIGGSPAVHVPMRNPVVQIDVWCCRLDSDQAPWGRAEDLDGQILEAAYAMTSPAEPPMPAGFRPVRVHSVFAVSEGRRIDSDEAGYARVSRDMEIFWSWST